MRRALLSSSLCVVGSIAGALGADGARAHVLLEQPVRRYDDMKGAVCGKGGGLDGRTTHFNRFAPGETITVRWTETIDHVGTFRVAFDDDGADRADFDGSVLHSEDDPENEGGKVREAEVTLPDVECTNCTLQFIQVMTTGTAADSNTYFQCADLVLGDGESAAPGGNEVGSGGCASTSAPALSFVALALLLLRSRRRR